MATILIKNATINLMNSILNLISQNEMKNSSLGEKSSFSPDCCKIHLYPTMKLPTL